MLIKLRLTPVIKKDKNYIFAETIVVNKKDNTTFKETHYILFPIQYLKFTNQKFDTNRLVHEDKVSHLLFHLDIKPRRYGCNFEPNKQIINQLVESFKDVFL